MSDYYEIMRSFPVIMQSESQHFGEVYFNVTTQTNLISLRGKVQKNSIFVDIVQIEVDLPPSYLTFDKFIFDILLSALSAF